MSRVLVLGGGITGLTAAYRLAEAGLEVLLLEASERTGGIVGTTRASSGAVREWGPDCFITTKPWAHDLAVELGLEGALVGTRREHRRSFVLARGALEPIPEGFHLVAPTVLRPFLESRIFSLRGKFRALLDLSLPAHPKDDEALESFVRRRLGREVFERLAEPLIAGIYTADPKELSLRATMPQFLDMEREHGSVIRGVRAIKARGAEKASGARYSLFESFSGGVAMLTDALVARLPAGTIELGARACRLSRKGSGFEVELASGALHEGDAVVVALPAPRAAPVVAWLDSELARLLATIPYASAATVNVVLRRDQVRHPLDGMGFVVPSRERRFILACTFSSTKFEGRSGPGEVLLRAFVGGALHQENFEQPTMEIEARVLEDLREILGIEGEPIEVSVHPWREAMPQYTLGHLERVAAIEARAAKIAGFALAGNAYRGVGIPDCVRSANAATKSILASLKT
jgi:oxygen-dependent protoporphyrinogen oxidase